MPDRMPAAFIGHGSPLNALERNRYTDAWRAFGASVEPRAILVVSAHWYVADCRVTGSLRPRTIHDFGGFPPELFAFSYPAAADLALSERVRALLAPTPVTLDERWGYDHGAWSVLAHAYPNADVPVVALSLDRSQPPSVHYDLARRLAPLRDEGVLILGSGNVVHNLEVARSRWEAPVPGWAARFEENVRTRLARGDHAALVAVDALEDASLAVPTPEHYLPFLYALAQQRPGERADVLVDGVEWDALSMLSVAFR